MREGAKRKQQQPKDKLNSCRNKKIKKAKKTGMSLDNKKKRKKSICIITGNNHTRGNKMYR
jgi:hypothetical protein